MSAMQKWYRGAYSYGDGYEAYAAGVTSASRTPDFQIALLGPDGSVRSVVNVSGTWADWLEVAKTVYPMVDGILQMPESAIVYTETAPAFNACTFTAAEDYIAARFGRKLHHTDKEWLARHPLAQDAGVPEAYTPTALHQLVEPYGLAVARIRVRAGKLVLGDTLQQWALALGCNPLGVVDHTTTNEAAAAALGMDLAFANELFRFEYHERPLPCSIIGEKGWGNGQGVQVGAQGGHARYLAPRGGANDWTLSIQLAPAETVTYNVPLTLPAYVPRAGNRTVQLGTAKRPDGTPVAVMVSGKYRDPREAPPAPVVTTTTVTQPDGSTKTSFGVQPTPPPPVTNIQQMLRGNPRKAKQTITCTDCRKDVWETQIESGTICVDCWDDAWTGYACPSCKITFGFMGSIAPTLVDVTSSPEDSNLGLAKLACRKCNFEFQLPIDDAWFKHDPRLVNCIQDTAEFAAWGAAQTTPALTAPAPTAPAPDAPLSDEALQAEWLVLLQLAAESTPPLEEYMAARRGEAAVVAAYREAQGAEHGA